MDTLRWTSRDLELLPEDGKQYEIVDGELYVSKQPHMQHQIVCARFITLLNMWSMQTQAGIAIGEPELIFADDDDVVPVSSGLAMSVMRRHCKKMANFILPPNW